METNGFFHMNVAMVKIAAMWIPSENTKPYIKLFYLAYNVIVVGFSCTYWVGEMMCYQIEDLEMLMNNVGTSMTHTMGNVKFCGWVYFRKELNDIIRKLEKYVTIYESNDQFSPLEVVANEQKVNDFACKCFIAVGIGCSLSACLGSFKSMRVLSKGEIMVNTTSDVDLYVLPYVSIVPFDYRASLFRYALAIVFQCYAAYSYAWIIVAYDSLYVTMLCYVSAHFLIIQGAFTTIYQRCYERLNVSGQPVSDGDLMDAAMTFEMNKVTKHLQIVLKICGRLEDIYTYFILGQMLVSLAVFCSCLYMITTVPVTIASFGPKLVYLLAVLYQLAMYCIFGNKVTNCAEDVSSKIYEGSWYSASKSFKISMQINMARMIRPLYFTMGKFSPLTLSTFVSIIKTSYSVFAVLKNTKETA